MKNLHDIIRMLAALFLLAAGASCSEEPEPAAPAEVRVTFTATLPAEVRSRTFGDGAQANTLTVGVFNADRTRELQRTTLPIDGGTCDVSLALAREQTYNFIFWAQSGDCTLYDISDLTAVTMGDDAGADRTLAEAERTDAFCGVVADLTVSAETTSREVRLTRPLAQVSVGTLGHGAPARFTAQDAPDTFHPFTGEVSGSRTFRWNFAEASAERFEVEGCSYTYLALGYLFAPHGAAVSASCTVELPEAGTSKSFEAELQANHKTHIAGAFTD